MRVGLEDACLAPPALVRGSLGLAAAGGASSLWVPDHLINVAPRALWQRKYNGAAAIVPRFDAFLEPLTTLGWLAGKNRLSRLHLGTSVVCAGRRNPSVTAQAFATLHLLTKGRAILGIGTGVRENNAPYGVDWTQPVGQLEEAVSVIRALWDSGGNPVSREGRHWPLHDAVFDVPPYKGTRPPIWIGAHGPRMLAITGRHGDGWLPIPMLASPLGGSTSGQSAKAYGERLALVRTAASDAGRDPDTIVASAWFLVVTAPTRGLVDDLLESPLARAAMLSVPAEEWARFGVEHPLGAAFSGGQDLLPHLIDEHTALEYAARVPEALLKSSLFAGTPAELVERFAEYRDNGLQYPVLQNGALLCGLVKAAPSLASMVSLMRALKRL